MQPLDLILKQIDEKVRRLEEILGVGEAKDFAEYQRICGEIKGLLTARLNMKDLQQRAKEYDE